VSVSLLNLTRWISLISGLIRLIVIDSMSMFRVGPSRVVIAQGTKLHGRVPTRHEGGAMPTSSSEQREQVRVALGINVSEPHGRSSTQYSVENGRPVLLIRVEEGVVARSPLQEIHGHLLLVSALTELHLFEFAHPVLQPLIVEEMGFNCFEEQGPTLAVPYLPWYPALIDCA
jgi:hypothetical protein